MTKPKPVNQIPGTVTTVNMNTGETTEKPMSWGLMPPGPGKCPICAAEHDDNQPHIRDSLYYATAFNSTQGRSPTWADAMAHCTDRIKKLWTDELKRGGHWSEPPTGTEPVAHHGMDE